MNWEALGAIAELIGAIAVILTLAYLAVQIRQNNRFVEQNTKLLDASIANSTRDAQNEVSRIIASDAGAAGVFWNGLLSGRNSLSEQDRQRFDAMLYLTFSAAQQGMQTGSDEPVTSLKWTLQYPGAVDWWGEYRDVFTEETQLAVEELTAKS
jgi:hypothetical protein